MRNPLSQKVVGIQPSGIRKFFDVVNEMKDAISLGVGEPDFDTPWRIREEGIYTLEKGRTFYTSNAGLKELKIEICKYLDRKVNVQYDYNHEVIVTVGEAKGLTLHCVPCWIRGMRFSFHSQATFPICLAQFLQTEFRS